MIRREFEDVSDVKNLQEHTFLPGQDVSLDLAVFFPCGMVT